MLKCNHSFGAGVQFAIYLGKSCHSSSVGWKVMGSGNSMLGILYLFVMMVFRVTSRSVFLGRTFKPSVIVGAVTAAEYINTALLVTPRHAR